MEPVHGWHQQGAIPSAYPYGRKRRSAYAKPKHDRAHLLHVVRVFQSERFEERGNDQLCSGNDQHYGEGGRAHVRTLDAAWAENSSAQCFLQWKCSKSTVSPLLTRLRRDGHVALEHLAVYAHVAELSNFKDIATLMAEEE